MEGHILRRLKFHDFGKSPFIKVTKFRELSKCGTHLLNFHFCILFNHHGTETQQALTSLNVQQCQQHSNIF